MFSLTVLILFALNDNIYSILDTIPIYFNVVFNIQVCSPRKKEMFSQIQIAIALGGGQKILRKKANS